MESNIGYTFPFVSGDYAEFSYQNGREVRGFFETEDAWVGFDNTDGISVRQDFLMRWQALAFAATDIDTEEIWNMTEKEFMDMYGESINNLYK